MLPIEKRKFGDLVEALDDSDEPWEVSADPCWRDEERLRVVCLRLNKEVGCWVDVSLLRPVEWLAEQEMRGGLMRLELPEMGADGWAEVLAVAPSPRLRQGRGRLVTGTFRHNWGIVYDLLVAGECKPIRVTGSHPFWSVDRGDWIAVAELRMGERLLARNGSTPVVKALALREAVEPVYNIEVEGHHCYRVGQQGLLVHNNSVDEPCASCDPATVLEQVTAATAHNIADSKSAPNCGSGTDYMIYLIQDGERSTKTKVLKVGETTPSTWAGRFRPYRVGAPWMGAKRDVKYK
jgi:hypothetical protein